MKEQAVIHADGNYEDLTKLLQNIGVKNILLVCGHSIYLNEINDYFENIEKEGIKVVRFMDFTPNPIYDDIVEGVNLFHEENCDMIIAVGGGSAIDVAKCIKLWSNLPENSNYLGSRIIPNDLPFVAIPTTAGTGSEATRYAIIYHGGEKQSVVDDSCIPDFVLFDPSLLRTLPDMQKKVTMMDTLCHAIESFWSVNSTEKSREYSRIAIKLVMDNMGSYLKLPALNEKYNELCGRSFDFEYSQDDAIRNMLLAANIAGKAINITGTTAPHAMSYKMTSIYGIPHGHAVAIALPRVWEYMYKNIDRCSDLRGSTYLGAAFDEIAYCMECGKTADAIELFDFILGQINLKKVKCRGKAELNKLADGVNLEKMKNNPIDFSKEEIQSLYKNILA